MPTNTGRRSGASAGGGGRRGFSNEPSPSKAVGGGGRRGFGGGPNGQPPWQVQEIKSKAAEGRQAIATKRKGGWANYENSPQYQKDQREEYARHRASGAAREIREKEQEKLKKMIKRKTQRMNLNRKVPTFPSYTEQRG